MLEVLCSTLKESIVTFEKRKLNTIKKVVLQADNQDILLQYEFKVAIHFSALKVH